LIEGSSKMDYLLILLDFHDWMTVYVHADRGHDVNTRRDIIGTLFMLKTSLLDRYLNFRKQ
jgi:hypothetical protein